MRILVTAGNTQVPIDRVRCLTNIFTGRTGAAVALTALDRGHLVTLLTSRPESLSELRNPLPAAEAPWEVVTYSTFDELRALFIRKVSQGDLDAVVHSAAISDYLAGGIFAPAPGTQFEPDTKLWTGPAPALVDRSAAKVKSDEPELWLRLIRAPKLVDLVRAELGFRGVLVKFKLEVGQPEEQLLQTAERSRVHSAADLMVANTLEGAGQWAFIGPIGGKYERVDRGDLAAAVVVAVERLHGERTNG
jgi:phosphopantothenate---cysteine ligase (CTP)